MGHISVVYGCIQSPSDYANSALMNRLNREALAALPETGETLSPLENAFAVPGEWSAHQFQIQKTPLAPLRSMFGIPPEDRDYRTQIIPFGVSLNTIERRWEAWLDSFEDLLRRLYWELADVNLISELVGEHHYRWKVRAVESRVGPVDPGDHPLHPIYRWEFSGGPRTFRSYFNPD